MSSSACQGLQSCLEPRPIEPCILRFNLAPPPIKAHIEENTAVSAPAITAMTTKVFFFENKNSMNKDDWNMKINRNSEMGNWNFLKSLSDSSNNVKNEKVYVHPLTKRSSSTLSEKSLKVCTESLGSETGSDVSENTSLLSLETTEKYPQKHSSRLQKIKATRKARNRGNFPPPLTSISGNIGVIVKPHREGGRLVLKAVAISSSSSCFHAERGDGRLRLRLLDCSVSRESEMEEEEEDGEEGEEDMEGNNGKVGSKLGMGKLSRPSRCNEGGNECEVNLKTFWLAI